MLVGGAVVKLEGVDDVSLAAVAVLSEAKDAAGLLDGGLEGERGVELEHPVRIGLGVELAAVRRLEGEGVRHERLAERLQLVEAQVEVGGLEGERGGEERLLRRAEAGERGGEGGARRRSAVQLELEDCLAEGEVEHRLRGEVLAVEGEAEPADGCTQHVGCADERRGPRRGSWRRGLWRRVGVRRGRRREPGRRGLQHGEVLRGQIEDGFRRRPLGARV
mmetsp:Transcript_18564/g.60726  ORF Transcript_18564/g.60726 Transcript_18564/m.60726 type:complete len:220 (-) Transcript_18564:657-1316(-)